jgi:hypothetical protein
VRVAEVPLRPPGVCSWVAQRIATKLWLELAGAVADRRQLEAMPGELATSNKKSS